MYLLWHPPVPAGVTAGRGGWACTPVALGVGQRAWVELLPGIHLQGKCKRGCSPVLPTMECSFSSQIAFFHHFPTFSVWSLSLSVTVIVQKRSNGSQLSLRRNCSKYRCPFEVDLGEASSASLYATSLDPSLNYLSYEKMFTVK